MTDPSQQSGVAARIKISAAWAAVLFIFAYVDLFSLYRPDVRGDIEAGKILAFDINQSFLFFTTLYIVIPSVMVYLTLVLPRAIGRVLSIALAAVYAVTIVGGAVGEWGYYVLGSAVEVVLLGAVVLHAWRWRD